MVFVKMESMPYIRLLYPPFPLILVDEEYLDLIKENKCFLSSGGKSVMIVFRGKLRVLSHIILGIEKIGSKQVDHINRDPFDNRKNNLRICTNSENQANKGLSKTNTSGYKGISKIGKRWQAQIRIKDYRKYLGLFTSKEKAAEAYNIALKELHGEIVFQNKI